MSRRPNTTVPSTTLWQIRVTREEDERAKALAEYEEVSFSDFVRKLIVEYRKKLNEKGLRPPLKPKRVRDRQNADGA